MPLPSLPVTFQDISTGWRRIAETINNILNFKFDDSRIRTAAEIAAGVTPVNFAYMPGWAPRYGVVGDGVADDTAAFQTMVNANKGSLCYVPLGMTPMIAGITLIGSGYNGTIIRVDGELLLKASPAAGTHNYQGAWVGIAFENCDRCSFEGKWNGNRSNQPADEHIFCIALSGPTNQAIDMQVREIRGDGLYVNQIAWNTSASACTQGLTVKRLSGYNSADDGRNLLSVVACQGGTFGPIISRGIGGVIGGVTMPGGVDIEPNSGFQSCTDLDFGPISVVTAGSAGFQVSGKAITDDATRDWCVQRMATGAVTVRNTGSKSNASAFTVERASDVSIRGSSTWDSAGTSIGVLVDYVDVSIVDVVTSGGSIGALIGNAGGVNDSEIRAVVKSYTANGIRVNSATRTKVSGRVTGAVAGTSVRGLQLGTPVGTYTQMDVTYCVDVPADANANNGVWVYDTVTISGGTCMRDCNLSGYATFDDQLKLASGASPLRTYNVVGRNVANGATAAPTNGAWAQFDEVTLDQTAGATAPRAKCITAGSAGTWKTYAVMSA